MKNIFIAAFFVIVATGAFAQSFTGPEDICPNKTATYSYWDDVQYNSSSWSVSGGGVIVSGSGLSRVLKFTSNGSATVTLYWNGSPVSSGTKYVDVFSAGTVSGPSVVCSGSSGSLSTSGYNIDGTTLNWQQSTDGTNYSNFATGTSTSISPSVTTWYRAQVNNCNGATSNVIQVTVQAVPSPSFTGGPSSACEGSTGNVYTTQSGMSNYSWTVSSGGTITAGGGSSNNSVTVTWNTAGSRSVSVNYSTNGCTGSAATQNVTVHSVPTPSLSGPTAPCVGTGGHTYYTDSGMSNYVWTVSTGGSITQNNGSSIVVTWNSSGAQSVKASYTSAQGCVTGLTQLNVGVSALPGTPAYTAGPTSVCTGSTGNVYTLDAGNGTFGWSISGGTIASGGGSSSNTATVTWGAAGSGSLSVVYTNGYTGCTAASPAVRNVTINALPTPSFTGGPTSACAGSTGNVYTTQSGMSNYTWVVSGGGTISAGGGSSDNSVTVTWNTAGARSVSVNYALNGCFAASPTARNVTVNALPTPTFTTGPTTVCAGTGGHVYTTQSGMSNYTWTVSSGGTITAGGGTSNNTVTVTWNTAGARTVSVNYTDANNCTAAAPTQANVTVNALPVPTFTAGPTTVCAGATGNVYSTESGMSNYVWTVSSGGTITAGGGTSNNSVTVTWVTSGARTVSVLYTNSNGCTASPAVVRNVTVTALPTPTFTAGPATACAGSTGNVYTTQSGMSSYVWTVSSGGTITAGGGSSNNSVTVTWNTAGARSVSVNYTSSGCTAVAPVVQNVTVNSLPVPTFTSGPATACAGTGGHVYTTQSGMTNYLWTVSSGGTITAGGSTSSSSATITWTTSGSRSVSISYASSGCQAAAPVQQNVTVDQVSVGGSLSPAVYEHYTNINSGTFNLTGKTGNVIRWEKSTGSGWTSISNTTSQESYLNLSQSTTYRAIVQSGVCPSEPSSSGQVNIYPAPELLVSQEFMTYGGSVDLSTTTTYATYKWYKDGVVIVPSGSQVYTATSPGVYKVEVTATGSTSSGQSQDETISSTLDVSDPLIKTNLHSTTRLLTPGVIQTTNLYDLADDALSQAITYTDGLGRVFQSIGVGQSPGGYDVVQPVGYTDRGLIETTYLPYVKSSKDGLMQKHAIRGPDSLYADSDHLDFYQNAAGITHSDYAYAVTVTAPSPLLRVKEQGAPGSDWQPNSGHTIRTTHLLNSASQVRYWKTDGTSSSYYGANTLGLTQVTDENGHKVQTYSDKQGKTILKRVEADGNVESLAWLETYYVYDEYGRLKFQVPPKAVALLDGTPNLTSDSELQELIFKYTYDSRGRITEKKVPGSAPQLYVYDNLDRMVLSNVNQLADNWTYVKYDEKGRVAYTGLLESSATQSTLQSALNAINYDTQPWFEIDSAGNEGYSKRTYPSTGSPIEVIYFDDYDFTGDGTPDFSYVNTHLSGQDAAASTRTRGMMTGKKTRVIDETGLTSTWLWTAIFYDQYDRPIQVQSNNIQYTGAVDLQTTVYDFVKPLKTKTTHYSSSGVSTVLEDRYDYDHVGRVTRIYRKIGADAEQTVAEYVYNELGQVTAKKLHKKSDNSFIQTVDFGYTIRGWLKTINDPAAIGADFFAQELVYNETLGGLSQTQAWNGNITAVKWKENFGNAATSQAKAFANDYFKNDQLKESRFAAGASFNEDVGAYNEQGLTYDANGNIKTLLRKGKSVLGAVTTIDNLSYTYNAANQNQLVQVEDAAGDAQGFANGETSGSEIDYDAGGNLNKDGNKGISAIAYNVLNKVKQVTFTDGRVLKYTYTASGAKLSMREYDGTTLTKTTTYAGAFVYEDSQLKFFGSPEGRVVVNGSNYEYQYSIGDHQGNTRTVFTSAEETLDFKATFETTASGLREDTDLFQGVNPFREASFPSANHTVGGSKVYQMNQGTPAGPGIMLRVYPGDKVDPEVWAYHESSSGYGTSSITLAGLITAVAGGFGGVQGGGGESGAIYDIFEDALGLLGLIGNRGDTKPAAYLNYIFFDDIAGFDPTGQADDAGWEPVPDGAYFNKTLLKFSSPILIQKPGYIYIYLSYENLSNNYVYFDDMKVTYTKSPVVQSKSYYAFGMATADSWTRFDTHPNQYLYNAGSEMNTATGSYEMFFRGYDPAIGRMSGVDVMADSYSSLTPYNYAFNDPVYLNDPTGADPYYESYGGGGCGCWRDKGAQDYGGEARGADRYAKRSFDYGTYGSDSPEGGYFVRYGAGDGGALHRETAATFERLAKRQAVTRLYKQALALTGKQNYGFFEVNEGAIGSWFTADIIMKDEPASQPGSKPQPLYPDFVQLDSRLGESFVRNVERKLVSLSGTLSPDAAGYSGLLDEISHLDPGIDIVDDPSKYPYSPTDPRNKPFEYLWGYKIGTSADPSMSGGYIYDNPVSFPIGSPVGWVINPGVHSAAGYTSMIRFDSSVRGVQWWVSFHVYIKLPGS